MAILLNRVGISHTKIAGLNAKNIPFNNAINLAEEFRIGENGKKVFFTLGIPSAYCDLIYPFVKFNKKNAVFANKKHKTDFKNYITKPIKKITRVPYVGTVFNFETETNTYLAGEIVGHNCLVGRAICSECGNIAFNENQLCAHIRNHKGKKIAGKMCFEWNYDVTGSEISYVGIGADRGAKVNIILAEYNSNLAKFGSFLKSCNDSLTKEIGNEFIRIASKKSHDTKDILEVESLTKILERKLES
jgi:hypothetical protein